MISYIGGKARIGKWIVPYIPNNIETFVEPFGGMFWVYFNMDLKKYPNLKNVIYNDFNNLNTNLFRCSVQYDKLLNELVKYPCQQLKIVDTPSEYGVMFKKFQKEVFDDNLVIGDEPNFDIAAKYTYVLTQVFSGSKPETSNYMNYKGVYRCKYLIFQDKLKNKKFREHFDKINFIESKDFQELIEKYDSPSTYFYLDPPYWKTENYYSAHDFDSEDHHRLAQCLHNIKGKFSLSYYEFTQLLEWFPKDKYGWATKDFAKASSAARGKTQNKGSELLIMNYENQNNIVINKPIKQEIKSNIVVKPNEEKIDDFWLT